MKLRALFHPLLSLSLAFSLAMAASPALAHDEPTDPNEGVAFEQNMDAQIPLNLEFRDETGKTVRLGEYFTGQPAILVFAYYDCPMLCTLALNDLAKALKGVSFKVGKDFQVVTVSIAPNEGPDLASKKKNTYLSELNQPGAEAGWHFLTGDAQAIASLTEVAGFHYRYVEKEKEYAHPTGVILLTPQGKISRYILGIGYPSQDIRLGLVEASNRKIATPVDQFYLLCYQYDPVTGRYSLLIHRVLQIAGVLSVIALALVVLALSKSDKGKPQPRLGV